MIYDLYKVADGASLRFHWPIIFREEWKFIGELHSSSNIVLRMLNLKSITWLILNYLLRQTGSRNYCLQHPFQKFWRAGSHYLSLGLFPISLIKEERNKIWNYYGVWFGFSLGWCFITKRKKGKISISFIMKHRLFIPLLPILIIFVFLGIKTLRERKDLLEILCFMSLLINICILLFFSFAHNRGSIPVMDYLREKAVKGDSVYFLTDCHQTPFYSFIHK